MKREYLFYGLGYLVFAMLFLGPLGYVGYREYDEKKTGEAQAQWKKEGNEQKRLAEKAVAKLRNDYPQRSEIMAENEIPKIARGTTGQAKLVRSGCDHPPWGWSLSMGGQHVTSDGDGSEWDLTDGGIVTVPIDASSGVYSASLVTEEQCEGFDPDDSEYRRYIVEFEVVCMKVTITAVQN